MIKVSVIIPVYNVAEYLDECLLSVINQSLEEIEIICINDGSTDRSLSILEKYAQMDSRIRIISKKNTGYGHSVNVGLNTAMGEYISIVESDDYIDSNMLEDMYTIAHEENLDLIKADSRRFVHNDKKQREFTERSVLPAECKELYAKIISKEDDVNIFKGYVYTWAGIYKRSFLDQNNIRHNETPGASYQDNGFWFQTIMCARRVYFLNKAYYNLRRDNPNSSIKSKEKVFCICEEYDFIRDKVCTADINMQKELLYQVFYYRFKNYVSTYERIEDSYKTTFVDRMQKDFQFALEKGEIDFLRFSSTEQAQICTVMCYGRFVSRRYLQLSTRVKEILDKTDNIYIYGAGVLGKRALKVLDECSMKKKTKGFLVSTSEGNPKILEKMPVYQFNKVIMSEEDLILISVGEKNLIDVLRTLQGKGHKNYLLLREIL